MKDGEEGFGFAPHERDAGKFEGGCRRTPGMRRLTRSLMCVNMMNNSISLMVNKTLLGPVRP